MTDKSCHILDSYDTQTPGWGDTHRQSWKAIAERPYLAGGFCWTGFDYRGEPTPFSWSSVSSSFGIMDTCGFPKSAFYIRQAFSLEKPVLQLIPHWNWLGKEGQPIKVMALTNAETVALFLNDRLISEQPVDKYEMVSWEVPYAPGKLEAIGKKGGKEISRSLVETTGAPVALQLIPDRTQIQGDGRDALPVTEQAVDEKGRIVPTANIGTGNGDPNSHESEKANRRSLFNGLAQMILQSQAGGNEPIYLRASSPGLKPAEAKIAVVQVAPLPVVEVVNPVFTIGKWRISPITETKPDPLSKPPENDQNSWVNINPKQPQKFIGGRWAIFRSTFEPFAMQNKHGAQITFADITGKAEVWVDGKLAGTKKSSIRETFVASLPPGQGTRVIHVLAEAETDVEAGLSGAVIICDK